MGSFPETYFDPGILLFRHKIQNDGVGKRSHISEILQHLSSEFLSYNLTVHVRLFKKRLTYQSVMQVPFGQTY